MFSKKAQINLPNFVIQSIDKGKLKKDNGNMLLISINSTIIPRLKFAIYFLAKLSHPILPTQENVTFGYTY